MRFPIATLMLAGLSLTQPAAGQDCETTLESDDRMQFSVGEIHVDEECEEYTIHLVHTGELEDNIMGHNWVLAEEEHRQPVITDGVSAGLSRGYLKPGDERVLAHTTLIGGGEDASVTFPTDQLKEGKEYIFFCSFPGHAVTMSGQLTLN